MLDDVTTLTAATRRDARRRVRVGVAVYAICLVALLAIGSYLAPQGTAGDAGDDGTSSTLQSR